MERAEVRFDMINESKRIIDTVESCYIIPFFYIFTCRVMHALAFY